MFIDADRAIRAYGNYVDDNLTTIASAGVPSDKVIVITIALLLIGTLTMLAGVVRVDLERKGLYPPK